jgi:predicted ATP-dependent endonuclease of OLD family
LETDHLFTEADVTSLWNLREDKDIFNGEAFNVFNNLSSGHKIVLLTITRLVEKVEEKTLVLMDEPESHLHPPLLASFIRALSLLMIDRNGMAIIATHSPVVLQEIPRRCVLVLERSGNEIKADRPPSETFGENVGVLTRDVFGLEVIESGFHVMLKEAVNKSKTLEEAEGEFRGELGGEAKALMRALFLTKTAN